MLTVSVGGVGVGKFGEGGGKGVSVVVVGVSFVVVTSSIVGTSSTVTFVRACTDWSGSFVLSSAVGASAIAGVTFVVGVSCDAVVVASCIIGVSFVRVWFGVSCAVGTSSISVPRQQ